MNAVCQLSSKHYDPLVQKWAVETNVHYMHKISLCVHALCVCFSVGSQTYIFCEYREF